MIITMGKVGFFEAVPTQSLSKCVLTCASKRQMAW